MNQQWVPRVQGCEAQIRELTQRLDHMETAIRVVSLEANSNQSSLRLCSLELCTVSQRLERLLSAVLERPFASWEQSTYANLVSELRSIAQYADARCREVAPEADDAERRRGERVGRIQAQIALVEDEREEERLSGLPGVRKEN